MKQTTSTARPSGALISSNVAVSCTSLYEQAKIAQKRTTDARLEAQNKAVNLNKQLRKSARPNCMRALRMAHCENNHLFTKPVFCGSESCEYCGQPNSPAHERRIGSILPQVLKWSALSYLVITIPYEIRQLYYSPKHLNDFRTFIRRKLKKDGFTTATLRWHYAGDCHACKKKKKEEQKNCFVCFGTGCGSEWHPHINVLMPAGNNDKVSAYAGDSCKLQPAYLESWRKSLAAWFKKRHKKLLPDHKYRTNIYHNYVPATGSYYYSKKARQVVQMDEETRVKMMRHRVRYVTRATLRHPDLVNSMELILKKYKNTSHIGHWEKVAPEPMKCPCCEKPLKWYAEPAIKWQELQEKADLIEVSEGIYFLNFLNHDHLAPPN